MTNYDDTDTETLHVKNETWRSESVVTMLSTALPKSESNACMVLKEILDAM